MDPTMIVGVIASVFTGISLLPQLIKLIKEKKAQDISMWMLGVLFFGLAFWIGYGILKKDWIIIISNAFSLIMNASIVIINLKYKR